MKDAEEKKPNTEKEIDLLEVTGNVANSLKKGTVSLFSFFWNIITVLLKKIGLLIRLCLNSWAFILVFVIVIFGGGYTWYKTSEPYYVSEGQVISRIANSPDIIQIINGISIPNDSSPVVLNNDLGLSPEVYNKIICIEASWLIDLDGDGLADVVDHNNDYKINYKKDSLAVRMKNRFNISLKLKDQSIANEVREAIYQFLLSHPYVKDINDMRIESYKEVSNIYQQQAVVLDSLQNYEYFEESKQKRNNVQSLKFGEFELIGADQEKDKRLYYKDIIELRNMAVSNNANIQYKKDPIVFIGTSTNLSPSNDLLFYLKRVLFIGVPLFFILFIIIKRKELDKIFKINEF